MSDVTGTSAPARKRASEPRLTEAAQPSPGHVPPENADGLHPDLSRAPFQALIAEILRRLGEDPRREGLLRTPERVEKSLQFLTHGYDLEPQVTIGEALFEERHHNMVIVKDIEMYSLCEHHMLPFFGKVHLAYIPDGHILGLSKVARLVEVFARRLQVQERLTEEVAQSFWDVVQPQGVGVVVEAHHLCMMMRGVEKQNSYTITSAVRGAFMEDARTREEFLRLCTSEHRPLR